MPQTFISEYNPPIEGKLAAVEYDPTTTVDFEAEDQILQIGLGANVPLRRQTEILAAIKLLASGIRDRNLLEVQFRGSPMITAVNIDSITRNNRRTASTEAGVSLTDTDVFIAMGSTATDYPHVVPLETAIEAMTQVLMENLKDQAA